MIRATFWIFLTTGLLVGGLLMLPRFLGPPMLGQAIVWTVFLYLLVLFAGALLRSHHEVFDALLFLMPLSLFQVVPDALLVRQHVLWFPDLGAERIAGVPVYMAGLWVAPLLVVLWLAEIAHGRVSAALAILVAALAAAGVFGAAEWAAPGQNLWLARNVATFHGVAWYVLAAEAALGVATWLMFVQVQGRALPLKVLGAAAVSVFYAGATLVLLFVFRRLGIG